MKLKYERCLTLRLDDTLDDLLTEAAYDRRTSKAAMIRSAIRQSLVASYSTRRATSWLLSNAGADRNGANHSLDGRDGNDGVRPDQHMERPTHRPTVCGEYGPSCSRAFW